MPCSVTTWPSTLTRPCSISSSHLRRDPMPAAASTFCSRMPYGRSGLIDVETIQGVEVRQQRREGGQVVERLQTHLLEEQLGGAEQPRPALGLRPDLDDQPARQQGADDAVDVNAADGRDARTRHRLPV